MAQQLYDLIDACLAGDEDAACQFVDRYQRRVLALCQRMLGHRQDAEDAAQETLVRALRSLGGWDRRRPIEPWLLAIAANRCRTMFALRGRRPMNVTVTQPDHASDDGADNLQRAKQLAEEVDRALRNIRTNYAQAFQLFHEHELSYSEIAEVMHRPLGTVKTWVHRARREIVDQLAQRGVIELRDHELQRIRKTAQRAAG